MRRSERVAWPVWPSWQWWEWALCPSVRLTYYWILFPRNIFSAEAECPVFLISILDSTLYSRLSPAGSVNKSNIEHNMTVQARLVVTCLLKAVYSLMLSSRMWAVTAHQGSEYKANRGEARHSIEECLIWSFVDLVTTHIPLHSFLGWFICNQRRRETSWRLMTSQRRVMSRLGWRVTSSHMGKVSKLCLSISPIGNYYCQFVSLGKSLKWTIKLFIKWYRYFMFQIYIF